jgi:UDP-N-acetylmuramate dehydrogenase
MNALLQLPGLQQNVTLAPFTTYRIGGPADYYVSVTSPDALAAAILEARRVKIPYFLLGTGANVLIGDQGFRGLVIHNQSRQVTIDGTALSAASGATMADLINLAAQHQLSGLEHFAGIPSSVGGAIWQNLHFLSPDRSRTVFIAEVVVSVQILDEHNQTLSVDRDFFQFGYDDSILHHREIIVLAVTFGLAPKPANEILTQIQANLAWRQAKQPQLDQYPSCGSVFKKIEGVGAGRLIEQAGLKGKKVGGAQISTQHANFIVNLGAATAQDVLDLVDLAQRQVYKQSGYQLDLEIGLVGAF